MLIRPPTQSDRPAWEALYAGYAAFYNVAQTPEMRATVEEMKMAWAPTLSAALDQARALAGAALACGRLAGGRMGRMAGSAIGGIAALGPGRGFFLHRLSL